MVFSARKVMMRHHPQSHEIVSFCFIFAGRSDKMYIRYNVVTVIRYNKLCAVHPIERRMKMKWCGQIDE